MNRSYKVVFNYRLNLWQAVSEFAKGRSKSRCKARSAVASFLVVMAAGGVAQPAYSQVLSGANTNTISINANDADVSTAPGFSVDTTGAGGDALFIEGNGNIRYTDTNASPLTAGAGSWGLTVTSDGDNGGTPGAVTVNANGNIFGGSYGVQTDNFGSGATSVTLTGQIFGANDTGLQSINFGTDLTISTATVLGGTVGISATNIGTGDTSVTSTGAVAGGGTTGIEATNGVTAGDLIVNALNVTGANYGITATNNGTGDTIVTTTGTVISLNNQPLAAGIRLQSGATSTGDMTVNAATVTGANRGIEVFNQGSGSVNITITGKIEGTADAGIIVGPAAGFLPNLNSTDVVIETADTVTGNLRGIASINNGTGETRITASSAVTATGAGGIGVEVRNDGTDLTVEVTDVSGGDTGIAAFSNGDGAASITATGQVTGTTGTGISAQSSGTDLTIEVAGVEGGGDGIEALNFGTGTTTITATGQVTGTADRGIFVQHYGTDLTIDVAGVEGGDEAGIDATNFGSGATSVTATGEVKGAGTYGIFVLNSDDLNEADPNLPLPTDITINTLDTVEGGVYGISANNRGSGATHITATGDVTGLDADDGIGIEVLTDDTTTDVTVDAVNASGGLQGIYVDNQGTGETRVTATGLVSSIEDGAIVVQNASASGGIVVEANEVNSVNHNGIFANNFGAGATEVTATGDITAGRIGVDARVNNTTDGTDLTVNVTNVTGGINGFSDGISALNNGNGGETVITATGTVTGSRVGIRADNREGATDLTVNAVDVNGGDGENAMTIFNRSTVGGNTLITTTGDVISGAGGIGIDAENFDDAGDLTINANNVSGDIDGIYTWQEGSGASSVTATGLVTGDIGIEVINLESSTDLTVNANNVTADTTGIVTSNDGTGATTITATGDVTGTQGSGIDAFGGATSTDLIVTAATTTGGGNAGILANNTGTGATTVTAGLTQGAFYGILVENGATTTDATVNATRATGGDTGIYVSNDGTGATSVTATDTVLGNTGAGVFAESTGTDLTVDVADVTGQSIGIQVENAGTGATSVSATDAVIGLDNNGIQAQNGVAATDLTVNVASVSGATNGIAVQNSGTGATSITATDDVIGTQNVGVFAQNDAGSGDLTVDVNNVTGGVDGIYTIHDGNGVTSITTAANRTVQGGEAAIRSEADNGQAINITLNGVTRNTSGSSADQAIITSGGVVTLINNDVLTGAVTLGVPVGGAANSMTNNETWNAAGSNNAFGGGTLTNSLNATIFAAAAGAAAPVTTTLGDLATFTNQGILTMGNGVVGDVINQTGGDVVFTSDASLFLDMNGAALTADQYNTTGTATLAGTLNVDGFVAANPPRASDLPATRVQVLHADDGITGDFETLNFTGPNAASPVDYLGANTFKSADNLNLSVGTDLSRYLRPAQAHGTFTLTNAADAFDVDVALTDRTDAGPFANNWDGKSLTKQGAGTLTLSAAAGQNTYTGLTLVSAGTLRAGALNTFSAASAMTVNGGATVDLNNFSQGVGDMINAGTVNFGSAAAFDPLNTTILTVNGDYTGNGGTLAMRTVLGDDASPTDLLVITGTASGNTNVTVENIGGPGALTNNGILLIDVGAVSPNDQFILLGTSADDPNAVDAGAFRYHLIEDGDDWFLRSESIFRPEVPLVTALPGLLAQGNLNILGNLHQRMGDDMNDMQNDDRLWMRVLGGGSVRQNQENIASPQASGSDYGVQAGFDVFQNRNEQGQRNDVGFYAAYLKSRYDITGTTNPAQPASRAGVLRPETKAVGAYWTYKDNANTGFYSDLVFQYSRYGGNGESVSGASARIGGSGLLGSLEVGYGMPMNEHWSIQPQAQIVAQRSNIKDISLPNATVRFDDKLSLASRLGLRLVGDYITDSGRQWKPYARANYWHGFGGKRTTSFENLGESTPVQTQLGYDSLELGAGFTVALTRNVNLYAELDHVFAMGKASRKLSNGLAGSVGIRVLFGAEPPPPVVAAPPPAPLVVEPPAPPPPAPPTRITLSADALFDFDSAQLRPAGRDSLSALVNGLRGMNYEMLILGGHTDRFGTDAYNQSLSERRVNTVRDYLIKNGIPADGVRAVGYGESQPVTTMEQCPPSMSREALIVCLQPDRRVEVEVQNLFNP